MTARDTFRAFLAWLAEPDVADELTDLRDRCVTLTADNADLREQLAEAKKWANVWMLQRDAAVKANEAACDAVTLANREREAAFAGMWALQEENDALAADVARLERRLHPSSGEGEG